MSYKILRDELKKAMRLTQKTGMDLKELKKTALAVYSSGVEFLCADKNVTFNIVENLNASDFSNFNFGALFLSDSGKSTSIPYCVKYFESYVSYARLSTLLYSNASFRKKFFKVYSELLKEISRGN